ncbi:MAG: PorV/PorQ family protein [Elusimicrobiaceae bacterium]|nr:PorV/PorQ family protein [Elusimicrobiaceae bacterium]
MRRGCAAGVSAILLAAVAGFAGTAPAQAGVFDRSGVGTTAAQFLKLSATARGSAMGEAMTALADDASALYWNPAGLIDVSSKTVIFTHTSYLADSFYDYAAYAQNFGDTGAFGVSLQYMNHGSISQTDTSGVDIGTFSPYDAAVSLGFASYISGLNKYPRERFVLGVSAKLVTSKITGQDSTITADAGILSPWLFGERVRLGLAVNNAMGALKFEDDSYQLPLMIKFGARMQPYSAWDITADLVAPVDNYPYLAAGTEIRMPVTDVLRVDLRAGANTRAISDYAGFRNVSFGVGLSGRQLACDYSMSPFGELGDAHRLTLKFSF